MKSFHTAVQVDYVRWAITFVCQFGLLSAVRLMSSAEFIEMITAEAKCDDSEAKSFADTEQTDLM